MGQTPLSRWVVTAFSTVNMTAVIMVYRPCNKVSRSIDHSTYGFYLQCGAGSTNAKYTDVKFPLHFFGFRVYISYENWYPGVRKISFIFGNRKPGEWDKFWR